MIKEIWWWDSNSRPLDHESPRLRQVFEHFNIFSFDNNDGFKTVFIYNCHNMNGDAISYLPTRQLATAIISCSITDKI